MTADDEMRRDWLAIEAIVGDAAIELWEVDDGDPALAPHEASDAELRELAGQVSRAALARQRAAVDVLIREEWQRARAAHATRKPAKRAPLRANLSRVELLAMIEQLHTAHPGQFAQHYRNLDGMSDETLRALVEDMLALVDHEA